MRDLASGISRPARSISSRKLELADDPRPSSTRWSAVCCLAEAAVHCGQGDAIRGVVAEMERLAGAGRRVI